VLENNALPAARAAHHHPAQVFIIYYSTYGHIAAMARAVKKGVDSVEGAEGVLYQVGVFARLRRL
jgi:NAD(P)H dehydrogenase (quinone)